MKSNTEAGGALFGYNGGYDGGVMQPGMNSVEYPQMVFNNTRDRVLGFNQSLQMYEQQMTPALEELQQLMQEANALRAQYEEALAEKQSIELLATRAEKRVQEVKEIVDRYVGVKDAVVASDGFTYERETISSYIDGCKEAGGTPTSYQTEKPLTSLLIPNRSLKTLVDRLVTLQKAELTSSPAATDGVPAHPKPIATGRSNAAGGNTNDSAPRRNVHGSKESAGAVELNAKGERVHPCIRVYGYCNYNESCAYAKYPYDACLSNLKNKCRFKNQCHERHVEFRGPLDDYGNPIAASQGANNHHNHHHHEKNALAEAAEDSAVRT
ncbi:putative mitochondrial RNA binding protein [Leptomonas pyrrhocoris]|uniref:Putative mitochondrial RNA binding protein n=1 Tax=Leptomonas pyrrhocoris TaxID=157538 RepID=A0A0N0VGB1_LEPPY|nr:putative mitochondrial RNA binding protein [Leptomonas pyrrhocoris]XP_015661082.1 putative mitochondrial RNA binding protein [Leptomonas pyrrhocoris]XP_015661083.1 putative mitochondrial RNA binding protein [Leptomonas pyrrhocoris]KPA82642.1 putative mitochondrial RNA binding protein [Leptomonas pyrrhocoris]KPA82643.1 putative mitochondrial RNA binding protein [Leptomonas pyrrhocoris]KPA82644.1 putative mitochondrial RNA binding protein [Leptomonas pyrrhocoris]|eukprot:XP_015661081.1 putative mitochondrial RNA binding protein [Leptomonas pyrrhocoris]